MPLGAARFGFQGEKKLDVSYLVIAGGGAGVSRYGCCDGSDSGFCNSYASESSGGGGSTETPISVSMATNFTVTVGGGGAGVNRTLSNAGSDSVFSTITSVGGGRGGSY